MAVPGLMQATIKAVRKAMETAPISDWGAENFAQAALRGFFEAVANDPDVIVGIAKADFMRHGTYQGYTAETREKMWAVNDGVETRRTGRQILALRALALGIAP